VGCGSTVQSRTCSYLLASTSLAFGRDDQLLIKWRGGGRGGKRAGMQKINKKWIRSNEPYCRYLQAGINSEPLSSGQLDQAKVYNIASDRIFLCTSVHKMHDRARLRFSLIRLALLPGRTSKQLVGHAGRHSRTGPIHVHDIGDISRVTVGG
jgi:hypothetical protein